MINVKREKTASFDVDPQLGFTPLCPDELPVAQGHLIADELNAQAALAGYRIVSKDCHPAEAPWVTHDPEEIMTPVEGDYPGLDVKWPPHCVVGTEGNRLIPGLPEENSYDMVVEKGTDPLNHPYGACYHDLAEKQSTGVIDWLKRQGVEEIIVGGLATDYCVKNTVLQLLRAGFGVIVNLGACRGVDKKTSSAAIDEMRKSGARTITSSQELAEA